MKIGSYTGIIVFGLLLNSCSPEYVTTEELKAYPLNFSNGLFKNIDKAGVQLSVFYRPKDLIIEQEFRSYEDEKYLSKIESQYDSLDYFILSLSRNGKEIENSYVSNPDKFSNVVSHLSSSLAERVYMVNQQDTIPALDAVYARTFGATNETQVMLIFKSDLIRRHGEVRLFYDDNFFGTGLSEFQFEIKDIKKIPRLNFHTL